MAQLSGFKIGRTAEGVDQCAVRTAGHGIYGEITSRQVFLQRHCGCGIDLESTVACLYFAFTPCERVLLT